MQNVPVHQFSIMLTQIMLIIYIYIYICIYIHRYIYIHICTYIYIYIYIYLYIYICIYEESKTYLCINFPSCWLKSCWSAFTVEGFPFLSFSYATPLWDPIYTDKSTYNCIYMYMYIQIKVYTCILFLILICYDLVGSYIYG
jgi:hypothetical protein